MSTHLWFTFVAFLLAGCCCLSSTAQPINVVAGGSTFPGSVYSAWTSAYGAIRNGDVDIQYALVGSGSGISG